MSEGLPAGAVSLESEENATLVGAITDPTVTAAEPAAEEQEPEGVVTTATGVKMVPLAAVQAERGRRKEAEGKFTAAETELATIRPKAQRYDEVEPQIRAAMPIIQGIQRRPDLVAQLNQPAPAVKEPAGPLSDQEAIDHAKALDLYTPTGEPDVARAQNVAKMYAGIAQRQTQQAIAPFQQNEAQRQSATNYQHFAQMKDATGNVVDPKVLANVWANVPAEQSANPAVANVLYLMALGQQQALGKSPRAALPAVIPTESVGGGKTSSPAITTVDQSMMRAAGIAEKDYTATSARFKPGQSNFLE